MDEKVIPVVIPSYEPDGRLVELIEKLVDSKIRPIVIVNDGSGAEYNHFFEQSMKILGENGVLLLHDINEGKGKALKDAFQYIIQNYPDAIGCVTADSDGQHTPECILKCISTLREYPKALVLGSRDFDKENVPWKSEFGNKLTRHIIRFLCGIKISDTQTGLRGIPYDFMRYLINVPGERFEFETQMLVESKNRVDIYEIPIETVYDSKENHSTHFHPVKDSIRIYKIFGKIFGKFLLSSLSSSIVDLALFSLFCSLLKGNINSAAYATVATILARVISAVYNYLINYKFVFRSEAKHKRSAVRYTCLAIVQMLCSAGMVTLLVSAFPRVPEVYLKIPVDVFLFFCSYYIQHEIVYRK